LTQFNPEVLKQYIAPAIDEKPELELPDLTAEFDCCEAWMQQYFLSSLFNGEFTGETKLYAESIIARTQILFGGYQTARLKTVIYVDGWSPGNPGISRYLSAVGAWESVFLNLQIIFDLLDKFLTAKLSVGEREDRARKIANRIKHISEDIRDGKLGTVGAPLWLAKHGFATRNASVSYEEMGSQVRFLAQVADCLSLPSQSKLAGDPITNLFLD
jgi:hypothetical protein